MATIYVTLGSFLLLAFVIFAAKIANEIGVDNWR